MMTNLNGTQQPEHLSVSAFQNASQCLYARCWQQQHAEGDQPRHPGTLAGLIAEEVINSLHMLQVLLAGAARLSSGLHNWQQTTSAPATPQALHNR
jgi:hypothetical protein